MHIVREEMENLNRDMKTTKQKNKKENLELKQYIAEMKSSEDRL